MNAKHKNFSIVIFASMLLAIFALINIRFKSGSAAAQEEAMPL